jgi:hypothetical protein
MAEPRVRAWRLAPHLADWYWTCARFPSAKMARDAWERIDRKRRTGTVGVYRHGPSDNPGAFVSIVGLDREEVERIARMLRGGVDERLPDDLVERLCVRRAAVVVEATRAQPGATGRVKIRRPEDRGAVLGPDGVMRDPRGPGRG